jgi:cell division protein FtsB
MSRNRLIFLGIILILALFFPGYSKYQELKAKNRALLEAIEKLRQQNAKLAEEAERLQSDPFYIEKKARDKMGIGKEGEIRYKVIYEDKKEDG